MRRLSIVVALALCAFSALAAEPMTDAEKQALIQHLERTSANFQQSLDGISDAQWKFKAAPERWSIAETAEHVVAAESFIRNAFEPSMKAPATADELEGARKDAVLAAAIIDRSKKFQAPEPLMPTSKYATPAEALAAFRAERAKTIALAQNGGDLRSFARPHPAIGKLDAYSWLIFLSAHTGRHTLQIEEVKNASGYPVPTAAKRYGTWGFDVEGMDRSVKPGDDFFKYVNGKWAATAQIPADQTRYGAFNMLRDLSEMRVRALLDRWAADKNLKAGSDEAKVAALYRSFLDEAAAEKLDAKPIEPHLAAVRNAKTHADLAKLMGRSPSAFGSSFFGAGVSDDAKDPDKYTLYVSQSGLGLPDREFYLRDNFRKQKERYQQYVADMLTLAGWDDPAGNAAKIVALETQIADAHWSRAESRNRDKTYNPMTFAELEQNAPGFPWSVYFTEAGLGKAGRAVVRQNTALPKLAKIFADTPVETLQAWQAFHVVDDAAPLLSKRFADANWEFRSKFLNGALEQRPRWKRAVSAAEGAMGEAVGRTYVAEYFPADSKAKMEKLVADLRTAMKGRIEKLEWMSPETKTRALDKLTKFNVKIGYPSKWRDYSGLVVKEGDLVGNAERAAKFQWNYNISRLGKKVDDEEWGMTPQTVNAYYASTKNEIVFPAAILQPPFFDPNADPAVNYGAIGGVIGHEISHGFDDQGRKSDGDGVLRDWWAAEDAAKFEAQAAKLGAQYEAFEFPQLPGMKIIAKNTMGENIGDLGGILMALDAYRLSLNGKPAPVLDGFTGDQRVFLGWAQVWRTLVRDDALRQLIMTDSHSPGMVRAFAPLRNVDAWYDAFGVKEGDKNYVKPEDRVRIW